jgi:endonuclease/exonuclease/phosphatase family metal-dependent hydrolase
MPGNKRRTEPGHRAHRASGGRDWADLALRGGIVALAVTGVGFLGYSFMPIGDDQRVVSSDVDPQVVRTHAPDASDPGTGRDRRLGELHPTPTAPPSATASASATATASAVPEQPVVPGTVVTPMTKKQLKAQAEREAAIAEAKANATPYEFTIATFNVLGSQHSTPSGDHSKYPAASSRSAGAANYIKNYGVDIVGTQELKPDQLNAITSYTGFEAFPGYAFGERDTDNSILYDPDQFELVDGSSYSITFMNAVRPQTVARFKDKATGREFYMINTHVSAGEGKYAASRAAGHQAAINEVNSLKADGLPIFVTGDMNDRETFFCRFAPATGMIAAIGGSASNGCQPARALGVDWIMASPDVELSNYVEDRSTLGRVSDHHFFASDVLVPGEENPYADSRDDNNG